MHILNHFMVKYLEKMLYMTNVIFTFVAWIAINVRLICCTKNNLRVLVVNYNKMYIQFYSNF